MESYTNNSEIQLVPQEILEDVLTSAMSSGGEFAEIFVEDRRSTSAVLDDGMVEELTSGRDRGAGIRVIVGETTGFAHTADLSPFGLRQAAEAASAAARTGSESNVLVNLDKRSSSTPAHIEIFPSDVPKSQKVGMLNQADLVVRSAGMPVTQVAARYGDSQRKIQIANSDGLLAGDDQVRTSFSISCVASGDTGMQTGRESVGKTVGFELFNDLDIEEIAIKAARRAVTKLDSVPAPSGEIPVVVGPGGGGVLFHEACGHGLEADLIEKSASVFAGKKGELVAAPNVTLIDDGTMDGEWGRYAIDDEGHPANRNVLIENGVLTDYMWDFLRSRKNGRQSSGNGRRQSYRHLPMVRMTNTFLAAGQSKPEEIIADTEYGIYVAQLGGGQVNTATGDFVFGMTEAYLIEDGKLSSPVRDGNLIGNGPQVLLDIDAIANDFAMGSPGTCGKDGQGVPVGDGTPTLRVSRLTVGGTAS